VRGYGRAGPDLSARLISFILLCTGSCRQFTTTCRAGIVVFSGESERAVPGWQVLAATVAAYALGCITTAYYLVRLLKGRDIRTLGSGTVGGRNAGRVLGPAGFAAVAVLDALKGLLAVMLARYLGVGGWGLLPVMLAAVAGHIWPAQLGFRGGKGIATMVGALLAYNYVIPLLLAGMVLALLALLRSFTLAGMLAIGLLPLLALALGYPADTVVALALLAALAIYAHRHNLLARLRPASGRA
jgi:glycerol-3-phosphate acyltransferase PlsY